LVRPRRDKKEGMLGNKTGRNLDKKESRKGDNEDKVKIDDLINGERGTLYRHRIQRREMVANENVRDEYGIKLGFSEWTGNIVNDEARLVEGRG
jgi:hypothetical protein